MSALQNPSVKAGAQEFVITRAFAAPPERLFETWTDPKRLAQWWGPHNFTTPVCQMDVRPGGAYRLVSDTPEEWSSGWSITPELYCEVAQR